MTIREAIQYTQDQLSAIYDEGESAAIAKWVLEHITGQRMDRYQPKDKIFTTEERYQLDSILMRLLTHEPLQYVLNEAWFCGLRFYVDHHVLIPRPETEELVEWIISNCKFPVDTLSILDIGSGSGCIPITLKRRIRKAEVWSCDISEPALEVAKKNAATLGTEVNFLQLDFLNTDHRKELPPFDIIVSNPPYVPLKERETMPANVTGYEPATALFVTNEDPLIFYREIALFGLEKLNAGGAIYFEINEVLGKRTMNLLDDLGYIATLKKDMQGKDRMIRAVRN